LHGKCERIENITGFAPYWFTPRLREFVGQPERLPFDQHSVMALVAPRALLITSATEDDWCNPRGTQTSYEAARTVYDFLGVPEKIGIHYRPGGHDQNAEDWTALLDFADQQFEGKEVATRFDVMPYPADPAAMPWATVK
jgi:endo-1,4-beta-xylanase